MDATIRKYFPDLTDEQYAQLEKLGTLYPQWNEKINVISRRDIDNLYVNHVLHSLAIAKFMTPREGTRVMDLGTGGGFPGIPLAVVWPQAQFHLIDRIGKKIRVAQNVAEEIGLKNVTFQHGDSGECHDKFDFVVSRAVMRLDELLPLVKKNIDKNGKNKFPNGVICLKGGDLGEEIAACGRSVMDIDLHDYFSEPYFDEKKLLYVPFGAK